MDGSYYNNSVRISASFDVFKGHLNDSNTTMDNNNYENVDLPVLYRLVSFYKPIHGYLALIVCVYGIIANALNVIVLTKKAMISSTNIILTGIAISDGVTMGLYIPYALQLYVIHGTNLNADRDTEGFAWFMLMYGVLSVILHTTSIWLTVTLAAFRFVIIRYPLIG